MRRTLCILLLSFASLFGLEAEFRSETLQGSLGDILTFGWDISHAPEASLSFSEIDMEGSGIEILDRTLTETESGHKLLFKTAVYDSVGVYPFPSSVVYAQSPDNLDSLFLRGPDLQINSVLTSSDTTFRDIKGTHRIRMPFNFIYVLIAVLLVGVGFLIYWFVKRMGTRETERMPEKIIVPPEEAHVIALRAFETLKRSKYIRFEQFKEYYSELTHILKQYYENRFLIDALEQTTTEFNETMQTMSEFDEQMVKDTYELLERADFIKFAKARSDELEAGKALSMAIDLVNRSKVQTNQGDVT